MISTQDEARFGHLLQPIRDLASNWEINIASELEDYLVRWEHHHAFEVSTLFKDPVECCEGPSSAPR